MISIAWHVILLAFLILLFSGRKFNQKIVAAGMAILLLSVGIIAVLVSNPLMPSCCPGSTCIWNHLPEVQACSDRHEVGLVSVAGLMMVLFGFVYRISWMGLLSISIYMHPR